jgi:ATP-binding cassette subfamily A (ABC1) protein 1/ATP-binding cassette subfamily A (ABC1) protein 3
MAAKELLCSPGGVSVMRQVAQGGRFFLDAAGIGAAGMVSTCTANPGACVGFMRAREGGLPESSALMRGDLRELCAPACLSSRDCFGPVLSEFLTGFPSEAAAVAAAAAVAPRDAEHGGGVAALLVLPPDLHASDNVTYTLRASAADVANARVLRDRWASQPVDPWASAPDVGWKSHWFLANMQRAVDVSIITLKTQPVQVAAMHGPDAATWRRADGGGGQSEVVAGGGAAAAQLHVADVSIATSVKQYPTLNYRTNLGCSFAALFFGIVFVFIFLSTTVRCAHVLRGFCDAG